MAYWLKLLSVLFTENIRNADLQERIPLLDNLAANADGNGILVD